MKEFNLLAALDGDEVVTRDGREVRIHTVKSFHNDYPVVGTIAGYPGHFDWTRSGRYFEEEIEDAFDLFMKDDTDHESKDD